jgi:hypothetical protein
VRNTSDTASWASLGVPARQPQYATMSGPYDAQQRVEALPILGLVHVHALNTSMSGMRASVRRQSTSARPYLNVATSQPATATTGSTMKAAVTERVSSGTATSEAVERIEFAQPATVKRARPSEE